MAHSNKMGGGSRPGPKPAHSHAPRQGNPSGSDKGGRVTKASTPSRGKANKNKLH